MKRFLCLFVICIAPIVAGCKEPPASAASTDYAMSLVRPGTDIVVKSVRTFAPTDNVAYTNDLYYLVTFTFTNHEGFALAPQPGHFVMEDQQKIRYLGADSGNVNLAGIANYQGVLKVGESHEYTIGFRVPQNTQGLLYYDATF